MLNGVGKAVAEAIVAQGGAVRGTVEGHNSLVTANVWHPTTGRDHFITVEFVDDPDSPKLCGVPLADEALQATFDEMEWSSSV